MTYEALAINGLLDCWKDYLRMASKISEKYDKYPRNLLTTERIMVRSYERLMKEFDEREFASKVNPAYEWSDGRFVWRYPRSTQDIKDEAVQQNNCVASYINLVLEGKCHIVFMRDKASPDKSYITLEIRNNKVVQAKRAFNQDLDFMDRRSLAGYENYLKTLPVAA